MINIERPCDFLAEPKKSIFEKNYWVIPQFTREYYISTRAGEFTKKNLYHGKNRVFGPKNAQKKFGSPTPNFPPPQFGK